MQKYRDEFPSLGNVGLNFPNSETRTEPQARLSFDSASNSPRPRIILSRRLTFDLRSSYRKLNKALAGVS